MRYLFLLVFCISCQSRSSHHFEQERFGMHFCAVIAHPLNNNEIQKLETLFDSIFLTVDNVYNNWNPDSELSLLNKLPAHEKVQISPELSALLHAAQDIYLLSKGKFDPTIEPLQQLWKKYLRAQAIPPQEQIDLLLPAIGWNHVHLEGNLFWKDHPLTAIDVGGISKGYAIDCLANALFEQGYRNFYLEWGGEVRTVGQHVEGRPWRVGIKGMAAVEQENAALATSGDYYQCWDVDGVTYFHIFDPITKKPLVKTSSSIVTTCVQAPSCTLADGLATVLMLFPSPEEAANWASTVENLTCWIGVSEKNL